MIGKKDIDNVKTIMVKAKNLATTKTDIDRFDKLCKEFDVVGDRYLSEVRYNARL
jgi:hypothetical protein